MPARTLLACLAFLLAACGGRSAAPNCGRNFCEDWQTCRDGACVPECLANSDCPANQGCDSVGSCRPLCNLSTQCDTCESCSSGLCFPIEGCSVGCAECTGQTQTCVADVCYRTCGPDSPCGSTTVCEQTDTPHCAPMPACDTAADCDSALELDADCVTSLDCVEGFCALTVASGAECIPANCSEGVATPASSCLSDGQCPQEASASCDGFACSADGTECLDSCFVPSHCIEATHRCDANTSSCVPYVPDNGPCSPSETAIDCHCGWCFTDGLCCSSAAVPVVSDLEPTSGAPAGGTLITITGSGFMPGVTVMLGQAPCGSLVRVSSTELRCVTPSLDAASPGASSGTGLPVTVANNNDTSTSGPTFVFITRVVEPAYASAPNWNDYVVPSGTTAYNGADVACTAGTTGECLHAGDLRQVQTGLSSCAGLTAADALNAFDWVCDAFTGEAVIYSTGLASGVSLIDLLDPTGWKANSVTVSSPGGPVVETASAVWWQNPVLPLPDNSAAPAESLAVEGAVYTLDATRTTSGYSLDADKIAIATFPEVLLLYNGTDTANCDDSTGETDTANRYCVFTAGAQSFLWFEGGTFSGEGGVTDADYSIVVVGGGHHHLHDVTVAGQRFDGIFLWDTDDVSLSDVAANGAQDSSGLSVHVSSHVRVARASFSGNGYSGLYVETSADCDFAELRVDGNADAGIEIDASQRLAFHDVHLVTNGSFAVYIDGGDDLFWERVLVDGSAGDAQGFFYEFGTGLRLRDLTSANNAYDGVYIGGDDSVIENVLVYNNSDYGFTVAGNGNAISGVTTFANQYSGFFMWFNASNNIVSNVTSVNNRQEGLFVCSGCNGNVFHGFLSANNGSDGPLNGVNLFGDDTTVANLVAVSNTAAGVYLSGSSNNLFTGRLVVGGNNGTNQCWVNDTTSPSPGLDPTYATDGTSTNESDDCQNQGNSDAALTTGASVTASFVGKVTGGDAVNTSDDASGQAAFPADPTLFDWLHFDGGLDAKRGWGLASAQPFPHASLQGSCSTGETCQVWDWRLKSADTVLRNTNSLSPPNDAFTAGAACPSELDGSQAPNFATTVGGETFLLSATELLFDSGATVGDDDGLCESTEACLYAPNLGVSYQGSGDPAASSCIFSSGTVIGVKMYAYPDNSGL